MAYIRIDKWLVKQGYVSTLEDAVTLISQGKVFKNGQSIQKPSTLISLTDPIDIKREEAVDYVSRGAYKLENAFEEFNQKVKPVWYLDVGSSTGGFTDYLLQKGAEGVVAVDVGTHQLHEKLRCNEKVILFEKQHILKVKSLPKNINHAVIDVSFISIMKVLPHVWQLLAAPKSCFCLYKPQFELPPKEILKGGIVKDLKIANQAMEDCVEQLQLQLNPKTIQTCPSGLKGKKSGNQEYWIWLQND
jgi:23S rRNA (cytidine1920-2'-O)/16S rRNA (cytidine1409-2'-O)-methyltransferase